MAFQVCSQGKILMAGAGARPRTQAPRPIQAPSQVRSQAARELLDLARKLRKALPMLASLPSKLAALATSDFRFLHCVATQRFLCL